MKPKLLHIALSLAFAALALPPAGAAGLGAAPATAAARAAGDDFYDFVNGDLDAGTIIPAGNGSWGVRAQLRDDNLKKMAALYQAASRGGPGVSPAARKVGDYFVAQTDLAAIERKGLAPLRPTLERIAAIADKGALARYLGEATQVDADPVNFATFDSENLFGLAISPGLHDPAHYVPYLVQGGLALPSPEAYRPEDPARAELGRFIAAMLGEAGIVAADAKADRILALETRIAQVHAPKKVSADLDRVGPPWQRADFKARAAGFDWDAYFDGAGLPAGQTVGAWQPEAIAGIAALVAATPLDVWKDYLAFHAINADARFLPRALADRYYAFYDPIFLGPGQTRPLWEHAVVETNTDMPGAGRLFVAQGFSPAARAKVQDMVGHLVAAFDRRIGQLDWMTAEAKAEARAKLAAMVFGIGHPDRWRDISELEIRADDQLGNVQRVRAFNYRHDLARLGRPVDRGEWIAGGELFGINPMPLQNALTIPVTELQPPLFDPQGSEAANYGALGARIGRFIALAFDKQGSRFDAHGRLRSWWTERDRAQFERAAAPLVAQFSAYRPFPDQAVDGRRTLENNSADLAGLLAAHDAFRSARAAHPDGTSDPEAERRFFTAYAQSMRLKSDEPTLHGQLAGSPVAPARYRVATVRNLAAWQAAFELTPAQALYLAPAGQVALW